MRRVAAGGVRGEAALGVRLTGRLPGVEVHENLPIGFGKFKPSFHRPKISTVRKAIGDRKKVYLYEKLFGQTV